ncbi:flagellar basal body P-ring biosynthesis protein FlgA [Massilia sp. WF1]|uniref:flagellar basal body P-ring formation chaperone FlgA n=1 Tax=unclassified Massilia TaxID=2609279 RepID=UPI00064A18B3|nr:MULTISPECIES: flagellar basal body P-ring formation chaperone FlgA [unclassified Massilia]KLU37377.1 flagellar basal body P-ring biosynthesis protein FlgA [Massilia sp. WF1]
MNAFRKATLVASSIALFSAFAQAASPSLPVQIEQAARVELEKQMASSGLTEAQFDVAVVTTRAAPPCAQNIAIEPLDTRYPQRMRFLARCNDTPGWRYEYIVRARVTAMVAVASGTVAPNEALTDAQVTIERRDISNIADPISSPQEAVGQMSRRMLRPGDILRSGQLSSPVLVKRGDAVMMVARREGIEVSTAGEALDAGARGAVVRVRNAGSGQVVRMRVAGPGTVEPVDAAFER